MKFYQSGRSFFRKRVQIRRHFATKCTIRGTRGAKLQADATFSGRSMVEMLGVLAIIGVLSVGAIAGYSKAMMKYKLNKQTEQLNTLFSQIFQYRHEFGKDSTGYLSKFFIKLNVIPEDMVLDDSDYLYDVFNSKISIRINGALNPPKNFYIYSSVGISYIIENDMAYDICQNIYTVLKGYSSDIYRTVVGKTTEENPGDQYSTSFYGDKYYYSNRKCLRNMTLDDMYNSCRYCLESKSCSMWISFPIQDYLLS